MFQPLSLFVGLRYVRARSHKFFVSFITWVALAGVALGVAALIVVLSVMNGLEGELRDRLLTLSAHARVVDRACRRRTSMTRPWANAWRHCRASSGVAPYMDLQALAMHGREMLPVTLRGIDPRRESAVTDICRPLSGRRLAWPRSGKGASVDRRAAHRGPAGRCGGRFQYRSWCRRQPPNGAARAAACAMFSVAGIFSAGMQDHDSTLALADARRRACLCAEGGRGERAADSIRRRPGDPAVHAGACARRCCPSMLDASTGRRTTPTISAPCASRRR